MPYAGYVDNLYQYILCGNSNKMDAYVISASSALTANPACIFMLQIHIEQGPVLHGMGWFSYLGIKGIAGQTSDGIKVFQHSYIGECLNYFSFNHTNKNIPQLRIVRCKCSYAVIYVSELTLQLMKYAAYIDEWSRT